jgi:hypothetical protein
MRLIDADALDSVLEEFERRYKKSFFRISAKTIKLVRTIVFAMRTADAVSRGVHEQVRWERDVAIEQLESYGVSLGEKADVVKVVRCENCIYRSQYADENGNYKCGGILTEDEETALMVKPDFFCAYGERRGNG